MVGAHHRIYESGNTYEIEYGHPQILMRMLPAQQKPISQCKKAIRVVFTQQNKTESTSEH